MRSPSGQEEEEEALGEREGGWNGAWWMVGAGLASVDFMHRHWEASEHQGQRKGDLAQLGGRSFGRVTFNIF